MADIDLENARRIIDQTKTTNMSPDDSIIIDSAVGGTRRIEYSNLANQLNATLQIDELKDTASGAMQKSTYDRNGDGIVDNAAKVNNHSVNSDVPEGAKFTDTTYNNATQSVAGLMSPDDKLKLDNVADNATHTDVDEALSLSSENPVQNKEVAAALNRKQDTLAFDTTPTQNSTNPVTSGGVYASVKAEEKTREEQTAIRYEIIDGWLYNAYYSVS
ncbi:MAG: hypothetical protein IJ225_10535 [Solobacterium sp.]|nr:hypothetical protein [Solobacterium sp.]